VARRDERWTGEEMGAAYLRFSEVFGEPARTHGAAGWQMNLHALRLTQRLGFDYCSDTRGHCPFIPIWRGEIVACPQLPTTLPTLDELIGLNGLTAASVVGHMLGLTAAAPPLGHVYTLHAELEGGKLAPAFDNLLSGWKDQGYELVAMRDIHAALDMKRLSRSQVIAGEISGRSGNLAMQGPEFLAA
jgi:undecaprenyl phosphate-alpha-L-ara4FN deformylase